MKHLIWIRTCLPRISSWEREAKKLSQYISKSYQKRSKVL